MTFAPATQVLITAQFVTPMNDLGVLQTAKIIEAFSSEFPNYSELAPAGPMPFRLGEQDVQSPLSLPFEMLVKPRVRLMSNDGAFSFMFQHDRISFGWQRNEPGPTTTYPGFDDLKATFLKHLETFRSYYLDSAGERIKVGVAEIAYVNLLKTVNQDGSKRRLSSIYSFLNPDLVASINGYSYSWNELMNPQEGVLVVKSHGPFAAIDTFFSQFTLTGTFQINDNDMVGEELQIARARIGKTFANVISEKARLEF